MSFMSQVRRLIESSFEPRACECLISPDGSLTVRIFDRDSGRVDLMVTGIGGATLKSQQDVERLVDGLRDELANAGMSGQARPKA